MASKLLRAGGTILGTFVGATDESLGGEPTYQGFIVLPSAFKKPACARASRRAPGAPSAQDRGGIHTFRRGDAVE